MKAKIYLDFNSTHPPNTRVLAAAREFYFEHYANSSGLSLASQAVNKRIETAREEVAKLLHVAPGQIVFTSCATESNNLLIREFYRRAWMPEGARRRGEKFRVLSSPFEHPSVSECFKHLPDTEVHYFAANRNGLLLKDDWSEIRWRDFDLIAMMAVQNESGVVLPLHELMAALPAGHPPVLADFSQALPKLAHDAPPHLRPEFIRELTQKNVFITATGHKLGAGFGAGLIVMPAVTDDRGRAEPRKAERTPTVTGWKETALFAGGNQEHGLRAGSHNAEAIIAFAGALAHKLADNNHAAWRRVTESFEAKLIEKIKPVHAVEIIGQQRAPGTTLLLLPGIPIDFLVMALDNEGITVSTGTSCKSRSRSPSAALLAMGYSEADALSVVRLSYDRHLSAADMERASAAIANAVAKLT